MHRTRRSGRIAKELPILILGTDTLGKVFSEETHTVVLSRHGAGIVSRYKFAPDEVLTLRLPGTTKEAEMRLVGQIGGEPGRYIYGLAFVDSTLEFWPMEFPPPEPCETPVERAEFACSLCGQQQAFAQRDIEEDVYNVNGFILRSCRECGTTTRWKKAEEGSRKAHSASAAPAAGTGPLSVPLGRTSDHGATTERSTAAVLVSQQASDLVPLADMAEASLQSGVAVKVPAAPAAMPPEKPAPAFDSNGRRINRRRHVRVKVNFSACVRHPSYEDETVECQNMSKGGLCFHSRRQYSVASLIEIAAPYSKGEAAIFAQAKIVRVEAVVGTDFFRYGIAFVK